MRNGLRVAIGAGVVVVVGLIVFAACSGRDDVPTPTGTLTRASTDKPAAGQTRQQIAAALFGAAASAKVLGSVTGAVPNSAGPNPAKIEVTTVRATALSTLVLFTLSNVTSADQSLHPEGFNADEPGTLDIRGVTLIDPVLKQRLQPYIGRPVGNNTVGDPLCACSNAPLQMSGEGQLLSAIFPPLAPTTTTVTLELTGFPLLTDLPVTRS